MAARMQSGPALRLACVVKLGVSAHSHTHGLPALGCPVCVRAPVLAWPSGRFSLREGKGKATALELPQGDTSATRNARS